MLTSRGTAEARGSEHERSSVDAARHRAKRTPHAQLCVADGANTCDMDNGDGGRGRDSTGGVYGIRMEWWS